MDRRVRVQHMSPFHIRIVTAWSECDIRLDDDGSYLVGRVALRDVSRVREIMERMR